MRPASVWNEKQQGEDHSKSSHQVCLHFVQHTVLPPLKDIGCLTLSDDLKKEEEKKVVVFFPAPCYRLGGFKYLMKHSTSTFPLLVAHSLTHPHADTKDVSVPFDFIFLGCSYFRFLLIMQFVFGGLPNFFRLSLFGSWISATFCKVL